MVVILPTEAMAEFKGATGGITGLLAQLPGYMGTVVTKAVNERLVASLGYLAWPNRCGDGKVGEVGMRLGLNGGESVLVSLCTCMISGAYISVALFCLCEYSGKCCMMNIA